MDEAVKLLIPLGAIGVLAMLYFGVAFVINRNRRDFDDDDTNDSGTRP